MRDGEACTQGRAMATIKGQAAPSGVPIMQRMHHAVLQIFAGPRSADAHPVQALKIDFRGLSVLWRTGNLRPIQPLAF